MFMRNAYGDIHVMKVTNELQSSSMPATCDEKEKQHQQPEEVNLYGNQHFTMVKNDVMSNFESRNIDKNFDDNSNSYSFEEGNLEICKETQKQTASLKTCCAAATMGTVTMGTVTRSRSFDNGNICPTTTEGIDKVDNEINNNETFARQKKLPTLQFLQINRTSVDTDDHCLAYHTDDESSHKSNPKLNGYQIDDETWKRLRKISTPEMLSWQKMKTDHRKSLGSIEATKSRAMISPRNTLLNPRLNLVNVSSSINELDNNTSGSKTSSPSTRNRTLSGFFRKLSVSTKHLHRRSLHLPAEKSKVDICKLGNADISARPPRSERDLNLAERDHAIEEWTVSAKKCEELVEELEQTFTELIIVKTDRDKQERELEKLMEYYEDDLDERDDEIEFLQSQLIEISQKLLVTRSERTEAYDQRDDLLQQMYKCSRNMEDIHERLSKSDKENEELKQKCQLLENQVLALKKGRDSALQLWNTTVEERKQLHDQQISLTQERDNSLRQAFSHHEEISLLKAERDQLRRELDNVRKFIQNNLHISLNNNFTEDINDSGFVSPLNIPSPSANITDTPREVEEDTENTSFNIPEISINDDIDESMLDNKDDDDVVHENNDANCACVEENEDIAICIDTFDSRLGLKFENAFDIPRVIVNDVTPELAEKWNIKKHDRLISVNGTSVQHSDKKVVERLIKDTVGRTISLVLRREKLSLLKNHKDVEITLGKQLQDTGIYYSLKVQSIDKECCAGGVEEIQVEDTITKINSQDINCMLEMLVKKLAKKSSNRVTLRVRRNNGIDDDNFKFQPHRRSQSLPQIQRKKSQTALPGDSTRNVLNDISSLFSFTSISQNNNNKANTMDNTTISSKTISGSKSPLRPRVPKSPKVKNLNIPKVSVEEPVDKNKLYSPVRSDSFESFTQIFMDHYNNTDDVPRHNPDVIKPPKRNSLYRPSPRLRGIDNLTERRSPKARSLYLEVLNRRSYSIPTEPTEVLHRQSLIPDLDILNRRSFTLSDPEKLDPRQSSHEVVKSSSLRNIAGYATLPRKYKRNKSREKQTVTRTVRINKTVHEFLGFHICGGNKVGIFVNEVFKGSPADIAGLKVGDKLLHLNSIDLTNATLDFATRVVLSNRKRLKIRVQVAEHPDYPDILDTPILESLYVRCLHSYNAVNLNEMSFKTGDILHITDTRYNYDAATLAWTWYGIKKVSALKHCEGEIPAIETFADSEVTEQSTSGENNTQTRRSFRKISKSAQDIKKWFSKRPSRGRKKPVQRTESRSSRSSSFNENSKRSSFYEILVEEHHEHIRIS